MIKVEREAMSASSAAQVDKMTQGVLLGCTLHLRLCLPKQATYRAAWQWHLGNAP